MRGKREAGGRPGGKAGSSSRSRAAGGPPASSSQLRDPRTRCLQDAPCPRSNSAAACARAAARWPTSRPTLGRLAALCGRVVRSVLTMGLGSKDAGQGGSAAPGRAEERAAAEELVGRRSGEQPEGAPPQSRCGGPLNTEASACHLCLSPLPVTSVRHLHRLLPLLRSTRSLPWAAQSTKLAGAYKSRTVQPATHTEGPLDGPQLPLCPNHQRDHVPPLGIQQGQR